MISSEATSLARGAWYIRSLWLRCLRLIALLLGLLFLLANHQRQPLRLRRPRELALNCCASPPCRLSTHTWAPASGPPREERNASHLPSGLHRCEVSDSLLVVSRGFTDPSHRTIHTSVSHLSASRSTVSVTVRIWCPSSTCSIRPTCWAGDSGSNREPTMQ